MNTLVFRASSWRWWTSAPIARLGRNKLELLCVADIVDLVNELCFLSPKAIVGNLVARSRR